MAFSSEQISTETLSSAKFGGYNRLEVDELIDVIKSEYKKLEKKLKAASVYEQKAQQFDQNYRELNEALLVAQKSKSAILEEARAESGRIIGDAQRQAREIKDEAAREASSLADEVQRDTQKMISDAKIVSQKILDDAQVAAHVIVEKINNERRQYATTHGALKQYVEDLSDILKDDAWLTTPIVAKSASLKPASKAQDSDTETDVETSQSKHEESHEAFPGMTSAQLEAFQHLQQTSQSIQQLGQQALSDKRQSKINTPQQAQELLNKLKPHAEVE